jgi:hypothetical protein
VPGAEIRAHTVSELVTVRLTRAAEDTSQFDIEIAPKPTLPPAAFSCKVRVDVLDPSGKRYPGLSIPVTGQVQPAIRPLPAQVLLGRREMGSLVEATVTLQAPAAGKWVVDHLEADSADVAVDEVGVAGIPRGRVFRIRQRIAADGYHSSDVRFIVRKADGARETLVTKVVYEGVPPAQGSTGTRKGAMP